MQTIQMHLTAKKNVFSLFFSAFFISALSFEHFQTKMAVIASILPELPTSKDVVG